MNTKGKLQNFVKIGQKLEKLVKNNANIIWKIIRNKIRK